jgi:hypothetical protein
VVQATLCVALVAGATMLARSLDKLEHQDFGSVRAHVTPSSNLAERSASTGPLVSVALAE